MNQIEYYNLTDLEKIFAAEKPRKILIVTRGNSYKKNWAKEKIDCLAKNIKLEFFSDYETDVKIEDIGRGVELLHRKNYDLIIACGGGSTIDAAKLINFFSNQEFKVSDYLKGEFCNVRKVKPLLSIPTTAGSGSEATKFGVFYADGIKKSVEHNYLLPFYVILDFKLIRTVPPYVSACSGMDALCQGIESYWSVNSNEASKKYSRKAIKLSLTNLYGAVNKPDDQSLKGMLIAANYSGKAINISKTTAPHALSYRLTSEYKVPHGHAVALLMPYIIRANQKVGTSNINDKRGVRYVNKILNEIYSFFGADSAEECIGRFIELMESIGLGSDLGEFCSVEELFNHANLDRIKNNPVAIAGIG